MQEVVSAWGSQYEFSATKLSERLNCAVPFTATTFAPRVAAALTQACTLDTIIDETLATLWPQE